MPRAPGVFTGGPGISSPGGEEDGEMEAQAEDGTSPWCLGGTVGQSHASAQGHWKKAGRHKGRVCARPGLTAAGQNADGEELLHAHAGPDRGGSPEP